MITVLLLVIGVTALFYTLVSPAKITLENDRKTAEALAQAKAALIGYAARQSTRPGDLPCPDRDNNGSADGPCDLLTQRIGRLPFRTLGLPDLRDGAGERLWYAVSANFKNSTRSGTINSDTPGEYTVTGLTPATNVIAVVFAPGAALSGQQRDAANQNNVANYLEGENANSDAIFTTALQTSTFNDKLMLVTSDAFFTVIAMRVARQLQVILQNYFNANGYYPFANSYSDPTYGCTPGELRGRIPNPGGLLSISLCTLADTSWVFPAWYASNNWNDVVFYAVAPACTSPLSLGACLGAGGLLTVNGVAAPNNDKRAIVIVSGRALGSQPRPTTSAADYLEDAENTNSDNIYVKNPLSAVANDRLLIVAP